MSEGYELSSNMNQDVLPYGIKSATAAVRLRKGTGDPVLCVDIELGDDEQDEVTARLVLSVREATWLAEQLPTLLGELASYESNIEAAVEELRGELDGQ